MKNTCQKISAISKATILPKYRCQKMFFTESLLLGAMPIQLKKKTVLNYCLL